MATLSLPKSAEFNTGQLARGTDVRANDQAVAAFINGTNIDQDNLNEAMLPVWTGTHKHRADLTIESGYDLLFYSDTGSTLKASIDSATGNASFAGTLAVDTTTFFVDATNNRAGIGTITPECPLHIYNGAGGGSSADANAYLKIENNGHAFIEFETGVTHESGLIFSDGTSLRGGVTYDHNADRILFRAAGVQDNVISSTGLGIGTTPACKLHIYNGAGGGAAVNGSSLVKIENNGTAYLEFETGASDNAGFLFSDSTGSQGALFWSHASNSLTFGNSGAQAVLNSSGDLSIVSGAKLSLNPGLTSYITESANIISLAVSGNPELTVTSTGITIPSGGIAQTFSGGGGAELIANTFTTTNLSTGPVVGLAIAAVAASSYATGLDFTGSDTSFRLAHLEAAQISGAALGAYQGKIAYNIGGTIMYTPLYL